MLYLTPVRPWFPVWFSEQGRRCLGRVLVLLCLGGLFLTVLLVIMSVDIIAAMLRFRYFYPPSEHLFRPVLVALLHAAIHIAVYGWFAVACYYTSRWESRTRCNEYVSVMVFGFLIMSLCEHEEYVALYRGVRAWTHELAARIDYPMFFYKYSDLARANLDRVQREFHCCGGTAPWMWHLVDWVGLQDEGFLPEEVQQRIRGMPWQLYVTRDQHSYVQRLGKEGIAELRNQSIDVCVHCPHVKPWSCCDPDRNRHRCKPRGAELTWEVYKGTIMSELNCTVGVYAKLFYENMVDWGTVSEVMIWLDLLIALLAKYLDSATNEALISGFPDGPSRGYLMQRCCGWFCPKPGFMPERPPPLAVTYRPEEATSGIFGAAETGLEKELDDQLEKEIERKKEAREARREERRQAIIDRKIAKRQRNMGIEDVEDDEMDEGVDDEADEADDNWGDD